MPTLKYICWNGDIVSKNDGDTHHITAHQVMHLYGVKPEECVCLDWNSRYDTARVIMLIRNNPHIIQLHPQSSGIYLPVEL